MGGLVMTQTDLVSPPLPELLALVIGSSDYPPKQARAPGASRLSLSSGGGARDGPVEALASVEDEDRTTVAGGGEVSGTGPEHQGVTLGSARRADRSDGTMRCA